MSTVVVGVLVVCSGAGGTVRHGPGVLSADAVSRPVRRSSACPRAAAGGRARRTCGDGLVSAWRSYDGRLVRYRPRRAAWARPRDASVIGPAVLSPGRVRRRTADGEPEA